MESYPLNIQFKTERIKKEFASISPKLRALVLEAAYYYKYVFKQDIVITELFRTDEEQAEYYPDEPQKKSVHQYWRGADIGTKNIPEEYLNDFIKYINESFPYDKKRPSKKAAIFHDVGKGEHVHLQVWV